MLKVKKKKKKKKKKDNNNGKHTTLQPHDFTVNWSSRKVGVRIVQVHL